MTTHHKHVHMCNDTQLCVNESTLINVCNNYKCLSVYDQKKSSSQKLSLLVQTQTGSEASIHCSKVQTLSGGFFPPGTLPLFPLPSLRKRPTGKQIEIANIHISAEPSLDLFPNILSVSICLQFFLHSFPPSLPPSCPALIGFRSCSTGRLLAPSHQNLATAARICPHTSRTLAFCLWMDGTESEGRDKVKRGRRSEWGRKQLNAQIQMNMHYYEIGRAHV